jgi:ABC-2 type transport system permease protein
VTASPSLAQQIRWLTWRSTIRIARQPAYVIAPLVFPLALFTVNSAGLSASTRLPGFPAHTFLAFALAVPFVQGALISSLNVGTELARDIQTGFLNRLQLTPMRGPALVAGYLGGLLVLGVFQAAVYLIVGLATGTGFRAGAAGVLVLFALALIVVLAFGSLGALVALRSGSSESVMGFFPVFFVALFISSMNAPRNLMSVGWFRDLATANPVSYLIEGVRSLIVTGWDGEALALAFAIGAALAAAGLVASGWALRTRLTRT